QEAVAALAAARRVRVVAEVVEDEGAVAALRVAEGDHLAQLALFERGAAREVFGPDAQARGGLLVEHQDAARAARGPVADDARLGERGEGATKRRQLCAERLGELLHVNLRVHALRDPVVAEQAGEGLLEL